MVMDLSCAAALPGKVATSAAARTNAPARAPNHAVMTRLIYSLPARAAVVEGRQCNARHQPVQSLSQAEGAFAGAILRDWADPPKRSTRSRGQGAMTGAPDAAVSALAQTPSLD